MGQAVDGNYKMFTAGAAIPQHARVKISSGKLAVAVLADGDIEIGTILEQAFADGDIRRVRLVSAAGTCKMIANTSITAGAKVWSDADGEVAAAVATGAYELGIALESAGADQDIIEVVRHPTGAEGP